MPERVTIEPDPLELRISQGRFDYLPTQREVPRASLQGAFKDDLVRVWNDPEATRPRLLARIGAYGRARKVGDQLVSARSRRVRRLHDAVEETSWSVAIVDIEQPTTTRVYRHLAHVWKGRVDQLVRRTQSRDSVRSGVGFRYHTPHDKVDFAGIVAVLVARRLERGCTASPPRDAGRGLKGLHGRQLLYPQRAVRHLRRVHPRHIGSRRALRRRRRREVIACARGNDRKPRH